MLRKSESTFIRVADCRTADFFTCIARIDSIPSAEKTIPFFPCCKEMRWDVMPNETSDLSRVALHIACLTEDLSVAFSWPSYS